MQKIDQMNIARKKRKEKENILQIEDELVKNPNWSKTKQLTSKFLKQAAEELDSGKIQQRKGGQDINRTFQPLDFLLHA